ncbi:MAG: DUF4340 domain-containing protein [Gammaproteobacteria bacterium]
MTRSNKILTGLFAVQLLLAGGIYLGSRPPAADAVQTSLLTADKNQIDHITVEDTDGKKVVIAKIDGQWKLPNYFKLPADQNKVDQALTKLAHTKSGWPVATTDSSHDRFEVSDDKYKTRITLARGDKTLEKIYLGTSPGFRLLHFRKDDDDEVYSVKLNSTDFAAADNKWFDRGLMRPSNDVASLRGPDYELSLEGKEWKTTAENKEVNKDEAQILLGALTSLSVSDAADKKAEKTDYQLKVKTANNEYDYRFFTDGKDHFVKRNDFDQAFKLSKADYEKITGKTAVQLVKNSTPGDSQSKDDEKSVANNTKDEKPGKHG